MSVLKAIRVEDAKATTLEPGRSSKPLVNMDIGAKNLQVIWMETPEGWKSDQHTRDVEEVLYILSGKCAIISENGRVEGTAGTIIFVPPGEKHQHENIGSQTFSQLVIFAPPMKR
jgi:quercetin dioxygenase-like cupin family protein